MIIEMNTESIPIKNKGISIKHNFIVKQEIEESFTDFHLFCISIVRDLINNRSVINNEHITYDFNFEPIADETKLLLDYMSEDILKEKINFAFELKKLME